MNVELIHGTVPIYERVFQPDGSNQFLYEANDDCEQLCQTPFIANLSNG
jgi:hypothetical protein